LDAGINKSKHEILLFTDVDCTIQEKWVESMVRSFTDKTEYLVGFSESIGEQTLAAKFQKVDFLVLLGAARAMVNNNSAWACSGQNQAYRKSLFNKVGGFSKISNQMQGDDSLFLLLCRKNYNINVSFATDPASFVVCRTEDKFIPFLKQRIRWAGDSKIFWKFNIPLYMTSIATLIFNCAFLLVPVLSFFINVNYFLIMFIFSNKILVEMFLLHKTKKIYNRQISILNTLFWLLLQPIYIVTVSLSSILNINSNWRGRQPI